jgi:hypothetical protein
MCRRSSHPSNSFLKQHEARLTTLAMSVWGIPDGIPEGRAVEDRIPFFLGTCSCRNQKSWSVEQNEMGSNGSNGVIQALQEVIGIWKWNS